MRKDWRYFCFAALVVVSLAACSGRQSESPASQISKLRDYRYTLQAHPQKIVAGEGERVELQIKIQNKGRATWDSGGTNPCRVSFHLLGKDGRIVRFENRRYPLTQNISPGEWEEMEIELKTPLAPGSYLLEFDLLQEGLSWFKEYGNETLRLPLDVIALSFPEAQFKLDTAPGPYTKINSSREEFNSLLKLIRITLKHNEVSFQGKTGKISGFSAGSGYPQIWLRDANTIIPASRYFYGSEYLISWLKEHLAYQRPSGALEDWIDAKGNADKNTTETDQEASAVQAAWQATQALGPQWLEEKVNGRAVIDRLEESLKSVLKERLDINSGLIKGAHTADWGDVDIGYGDQRAIYVDESTHWTADIYDQSMFYQAGQSLARMLEAAGRKERARFWTGQAALIQKAASQRLWQPEKGFFKVHLHLDSLRHDFDESDIFAMGGNAVAVVSGLADKNQSQKIIETALERQKVSGISTISGALLPPYPAGFFKHPALDEPYEYQNGGQWDWFGGRLISAMFESGFSRQAREKLLEIAKKNMANIGLYEWDSRDGLGQGSDDYGGSAGMLAQALIAGYFGIKASFNSLSLEPKLGEDSAVIHIYLPAAGLFVAYDYSFDRQKNKIHLRFNSNFPGKGRVKILLPSALCSSGNNAPLETLKDGEKISCQRQRLNRDEFLIIETDFQNHLLEIGPKSGLPG
jgi:hypothetical protein